MSDYLFSSAPRPEGELADALKAVYRVDPPEIAEFHGEWGSLALCKGWYRGFLPFETEDYLMVVAGGPVLYFRDNDFLEGSGPSNEGARAIFERWVTQNAVRWDEDLSGPFTILLVDKRAGSVRCITDLMGFIPVYVRQSESGFCLGTHVDALATVTGRRQSLDWVSVTDFVLNDVVTYPFTVYQGIRQCAPGSELVYAVGEPRKEQPYWLPIEEQTYGSLAEAASELSAGLSGYVCRITKNMNRVAQFVSAGEDSRALAGMLPNRLQRDAFIFLDRMNREGRIAQRVCEKYGARFHVGYRSPTHYLDILQEAGPLVGLGSQYTHAHSLQFNREFDLSGYSAVFGGFFSDTLLKCVHVRLFKGYGKLPFLPQFPRRSYSPPGARFGELGSFMAFADEVRKRQISRLEEVRRIRPKTAEEWFHLYPSSMHNDMPNLHANRRLFASYEPYMCKEAVKVGASAPTRWKLNRRLFNRATQQFLVPAKWMLHADGRLPYLNWWQNMPVHFSVWLYRSIGSALKLRGGNQGPWNDWDQLFSDPAWKQAAEQASQGLNLDPMLKSNVSVVSLLVNAPLLKTQRTNLMQLIFALRREL
ncbi:hypothetical protein KUV78_03770 [Marinobacter hydrocarbonoclasticus]|uniref:hypothetical protein n=1 Tax=Marinobacter nauticus TaxID=2743 RepID=UPI001C9451F9|nr:hypothetical protein [Marinobacter nauticus]MBY6192908.1 hypothetical protein [Marinobacter nauticus]MBY6214056.1 hypothetical protein [Marinobacter nauticus]